MLFNSLIFIAFAFLFFLFWPIARRRNNFRWAYLTTASFIFYGWWDWRFLFLIIGSGLIDYCAGLAMQKRPHRKRVYLILSLLGNIGSLMVFKYSGFVATNLEFLFSSLGMPIELNSRIPDFMLILPVGISFYTFQSMSYTIDIYRGKLKPTRNILHFFSYLSMFPQLVAGPIIRASELLPQLKSYRKINEEQRWAGLKLIVHGYFKKVVIADSLAPFITAAFAAPTLSTSSMYWWMIITAFAFQIYCDFSGYSDIARGLAKWMGYEFSLNFNHPYISTSMREFWTRWHISLSTWFKDYVYIPLGGSRYGKGRAHAFMLLTMLISGLWHGAGWNFVIWGALHGFYVTMERLTRLPDHLKKLQLGRLHFGKWLALLLVIVQVWVGWVFFRGQSFGQSIQILKTMFSFSGAISPGIRKAFFVILGLGVLRELYIALGMHRKQWLPVSWRRQLDPAMLAMLMVACIYLRGPGSAFIYFQF